VGDFNGDHKLDVLAGGMYLLAGKGDGSFQKPVQVAPGGGYVSAGDFNGDGKLDFIAISADTSANVFLGNGDGTFQAAGSFAVGRGPYDPVAVADFNSDGKDDFVVANSSTGTASLYLSAGAGAFRLAGTFDAGPRPCDLGLGDFNGDGW